MSNLFKRILAGIVGIPLILVVCYAGGLYFLIFTIIISSIGLWELFKMFEKKGYTPLRLTGIFASAVILTVTFFSKDFMLFSPVILITLFMTEIFRKENNVLNPVILLFGLIYVTLPLVLLNFMVDNSGSKMNINIAIYIFVLIWVCDSAAYFGGRFFGKNMLSRISPKKTREGSFIGFILTVMVSLIIHFIIPDRVNTVDAVAFGIITGFFSQTGDLFESMLKRYCGVKDSSEIIPGHGGILDRFDSLIFVAPVIFVYLNIIKS